MSTGDVAATRKLSRDGARLLPAGATHYSAYVGPADQWDFMGATQFRLLTALGLREHHRILDVGCGGLRTGRLLIPYLNPGCYCGIEPNSWLVEDAIAAEIGADTIARKQARFSDSDSFDAASFGLTFDFIVAQSIFSHAGPEMLADALARFVEVLAPGGLILATFLLSDLHTDVPVEAPGWTYPGCISYHVATLSTKFAAAGLIGQRLPWYHPRQVWYAIAEQAEALPPPEFLHHLSGAVLRSTEFAASLENSA